ncbi:MULTISPECIES: tRNA preQ1(34) S-adenosylmethionine ribosyltransferase-isomerase QueA [Xanthomonas]|uniref:tRNA preQ1(34) S-adenosylmethionine ribosyltransferase-isomerase QueA n=1 Tax=Xanthomonas TaxID=338 RepID=UPI0006E5F299|nr:MULTISPECIES: tRNA preQ1(34) S-adenosylmethionine ribosyltransferase-isomerase QueA [Xanthomonas]MBO9794333.1 tRNA preQ1(34) S-adenosylmethionine ribosyltransferase-isomerase QueA [Xanthomonas phaseoli pv. dieffenbachiae]MBO9851148.1 tRNA preQ1(34) S-adenosylmethionine ribosyltransferase-isomerase QueA [Xanthomonas phaseoli pv. dieffenbachiae]MBV6843374.1 tRNA preQ1(34) S-adenosylmethionine ribosyltransferase-isomerase QueA [Xanthomonas campestris pv. fici]MBV6889607.1 tRNA preQ1(34) S-adeno
MKKSDFHYELPEELIAQAPLAERAASRLLVVPPAPAAFGDRQVRDLPELLQPGDLLIFNDTRVIPARLFGQKASGGRVEILIERLLGEREARVQIGASKSPKAGSVIALDAGGQAEVLGRDGEFYLLRFQIPTPLEHWLLEAGRLPLPPYIRREPGVEDRERYQTVFAREVGAVAAPTAGLHFDEPLLARLRERGVEFGHVTLHVGAGTFQPVRVDKLDQHVMHKEWLNVGATLVEQVRRTRARGGRVIAVGTTVVRSLESAWRKTKAAPEGELQPFAGETQIFILPGYRIRSVDAMVTNFHLPESTLMMMVCAFAGRERIFAAYHHAIAQRYRFFSYGDAMLLWGGESGVGNGES